MLVMWSVGEVIRYGYFALMLSGLALNFLVWLRYSAFVLIYPIGIGAEMWLVWRAIGESDVAWLTGIMYGELWLLYLPGQSLDIPGFWQHLTRSQALTSCIRIC